MVKLITLNYAGGFFQPHDDVRPFLTAVLFAVLCTGIAQAQQHAERQHEPIEPFTYAVAVQDGIAYTARGSTLVALDVSQPSQPVERSRLELPHLVRDIVVKGPHAYVSTGAGGLQIVEITNVDRPSIVGSLSFDDRTEDLFVTDSLAYVTARTAGLQVVDIQDPANPVVVGAYQTDEQAIDVTVAGRYAHVAASFGGHRIIDVSNPARPREIGSAARGSYDQGFSWGIAGDGAFVYVANVEVGLRRVDVSDIDPTSKQNKAPTVELVQSVYRPADVTFADEIVYLADQDAGLKLFYAGRSDTLFQINAIDTPGRAMDAAVEGSYTYVADRSGGLRVINVSDKFDIREVGFWDPNPRAVGLAVTGSTLYAADSENGMLIYDLSEPHNPRRAGLYRGSPTSVTPDGSSVFVSEGSAGLVHLEVRVSDPVSTKVLERLPAHDEIRGAAISGAFVLVADGTAGLRVFERSGPNRLSERGSFRPASNRRDAFFNDPVSVWHVAADGEIAYLACDDGVRVIDFSSPNEPRQVGFLSAATRAVETAVVGNYVAAVFDDGLRMIDVSNLTKPRTTGFAEAPSVATSLSLADGRAYMTDVERGVVVVDLTDPENPQRLEVLATPDRALDIAVGGEHAYVAARDAGIVVLELKPDS